MRKINFHLSSNNVLNQIRAYSPSPGAWFIYKNERIKILSATQSTKSGKPSTVLTDKFELACKEGSISPKILQREGKKSMQINDFLRGFTFSKFDHLN